MLTAAACASGSGSSPGEDAASPADATAGDTAGCTPDCTGKACGDDGCGGSCGQCEGIDDGNWCSDTVCQDFQCLFVANSKPCNGGEGTCMGGACCTPDCYGRNCGDDGCSGSCGECVGGAQCVDGLCPDTCLPACAGKQCGPDGCGAACGTCDDGFKCVGGLCKESTVDPASKVGKACASDTDCAPPANGVCFDWMPGGMCASAGCESTADCPGGSSCIELTSTDGSTSTYCVADCTSNADCRPGYFCYPEVNVCWWEQGVGPCSPDLPTGTCDEGLYCIDGTCQEWSFECTDKTYEVNDTKAASTPLTPGAFKTEIKKNLQICAGDNDWFSLTIPKGHSGTVGIYFYHEVGDLDLCLYDPAGKLVSCRYPFEDYSQLWRDHDWNDEFLSAFALAGDRTVYFKADGYLGATNQFNLFAWTSEWKDGTDCTQFFSTDECKGCYDGGQCVKDSFEANLLQFPHPDPDDPFVGDGYMVEHSSGYSWLRREAIMAIRQAIHDTQVQFPGTGPLGLMDMCQINGITPGFDVGDPRHPESTHDEGGNIDVAYYQTDGSNSGAVVCDPAGGSNNGYFCTSVANHVVDLPRTAFFMAKLAANPRFRVAGMDKLVAPLVLAEMKKLKDNGMLTSSEYYQGSNGIAYGDGWPFHHHHIHVSFDWWYGRDAKPAGPIGCGFRMPGDPTWAQYMASLHLKDR
jgi:hypothetical protein